MRGIVCYVKRQLRDQECRNAGNAISMSEGTFNSWSQAWMTKHRETDARDRRTVQTQAHCNSLHTWRFCTHLISLLIITYPTNFQQKLKKKKHLQSFPNFFPPADWLIDSPSSPLCLYLSQPRLLPLTHSTTVSGCRWWVACSCLSPPLLSVRRRGAAWPEQVVPPGFSSYLIGQQSPPSDTGHVPFGKELLFCAALNRGTAGEDITAAMLSSLDLWPCHSGRAGWRSADKMFVNRCG